MNPPSVRPEMTVATSLRAGTDERVLHLAATAAQRLGLGMRLVHGLDVRMYNVWIDALSATEGVRARMATERERAEAEARATLRDVAAALATETLLVGYEVRRDHGAAAVIGDAEERDTCVIATGLDREHGLMAAVGGVTPYGILTHSPRSVLAFGDDCTADFARARLRILIADDLRPDTLAAVHTGLALGVATGGANILHVHSFRDLHEELIAFVSKKSGANGRDEDRLAFEEQLRSSHRQNLMLRANRFPSQLAASGGSYEARVVEGTLDQCLVEAQEEFKPDLVVVGRHRPLHTRPLHVGQLPWERLLRLDAAILVVPPGETRFGRLLLKTEQTTETIPSTSKEIS